MIKLVSWNVNGLRACVEKGFVESMLGLNPDIICIQESKLQEGQINLHIEGFHQYWNYAVKKGYSGTAIFTKILPINSTVGLGVEEHDTEGRVITLEFDSFYLVNVYTPNSKRELERLDYRVIWEDAFRNHLIHLDKIKPVVLCGDLNVAHKEIDLKNPKTNVGNAGFTPQEREKFTELLGEGFVDTFRYLYPDKAEAYTWWSYMFKAREKNAGWRIDYFCVSERIKELIKEAEIHNDIFGSDHCPVSVVLDL